METRPTALSIFTGPEASPEPGMQDETLRNDESARELMSGEAKSGESAMLNGSGQLRCSAPVQVALGSLTQSSVPDTPAVPNSDPVHLPLLLDLSPKTGRVEKNKRNRTVGQGSTALRVRADAAAVEATIAAGSAWGDAAEIASGVEGGQKSAEAAVRERMDGSASAQLAECTCRTRGAGVNMPLNSLGSFSTAVHEQERLPVEGSGHVLQADVASLGGVPTRPSKRGMFVNTSAFAKRASQVGTSATTGTDLAEAAPEGGDSPKAMAAPVAQNGSAPSVGSKLPRRELLVDCSSAPVAATLAAILSEGATPVSMTVTGAPVAGVPVATNPLEVLSLPSPLCLPPGVTRMPSREDIDNQMNIPCVLCGVRFRKPGHLNMHWRSVHASHPDLTYPGSYAKTIAGNGGSLSRNSRTAASVLSSQRVPVSQAERPSFRAREGKVVPVTGARERKPGDWPGPNLSRGTSFGNTEKHSSKEEASFAAVQMTGGRSSAIARRGIAINGKNAGGRASRFNHAYGCPQCEARFPRGSDRNRHIRMVHEQRRPFACDQCAKQFGRKSFLEAHVSTVHLKQRPFVCASCRAAFGQRSSLTRHARKMHGLPIDQVAPTLPAVAESGSIGSPTTPENDETALIPSSGADAA